ncbi:MAG: hypothetical protein ABI353_08385, partial [Isosphaeraceae bacterium]
MMNEPNAVSLAERVERLEKANRRWRVLCLATLGGVGLLLATGANRVNPPRLDVQELVVKDKNGTPRLRIGTDGEGNPYMNLMTKKGLPRFNMGLGGGLLAT